MKAEKVIREQLAVQETPSLWCHLGDVLGKPECYQKAWELSNCRYARAQRSLGYHYLYKAQVSSFEKMISEFVPQCITLSVMMISFLKFKKLHIVCFFSLRNLYHILRSLWR